MRPAYSEPLFNQLPPIVWLLTAPIILSEIAFALAGMGFLGGGGGALRVDAINASAYLPEIVLLMWNTGGIEPSVLLRLLTYPFIHGSFTHALFVTVFTLALGKLVAEQFRPVAFLVLFFGAAVLSGVLYTIVMGAVGIRATPLVGGYPPVYALVGAFTFILWVRLGQEQANRMRAFVLIGMLLLFQLVFGLLSDWRGTDWVADLIGFIIGFGLSFVLIPGGFQRAVRAIRHR
ncbi:MAG: rhomboid family intramembrane serine protease [Paracoccus sp. (in: a-proteobacteria)]|nr:rhomboid family intramembrane serine protease [Paracoccus sp. (in: a-proteobacteria)]